MDAFHWESFGKGWVGDILKELKLEDSTVVHEADYGRCWLFCAVNIAPGCTFVRCRLMGVMGRGEGDISFRLDMDEVRELILLLQRMGGSSRIWIRMQCSTLACKKSDV